MFLSKKNETFEILLSILSDKDLKIQATDSLSLSLVSNEVEFPLFDVELTKEILQPFSTKDNFLCKSNENSTKFKTKIEILRERFKLRRIKFPRK